MKKLTIAYFGTPYFSAHLLEKIITDVSINQLIEIKFVLTQPDKPVGRKQTLTPSPVKQIAKRYNIPVVEDLQMLHVTRYMLHDLDFAFLYAYNEFIPTDLLNLPKLGFLNAHPSLLPKYRGPSPTAYPLIFGDKETGVTLIKLDEKLDHGPILMQEKLEILANDRRPSLEIKLTDLAYELFKKLIMQLTSPSSYVKTSEDKRVNELKFIEQNHKNAIVTKKLEKKDGFIPFPVLQKALKNTPLTQNELPELIRNLKLEIRNSSKIIYNYFRGMYPWPGLWTLVKINGAEKRLKITDIEYKNNQLALKKVQLEGKNEVDFKTFQSAYNVFTT